MLQCLKIVEVVWSVWGVRESWCMRTSSGNVVVDNRKVSPEICSSFRLRLGYAQGRFWSVFELQIRCYHNVVTLLSNTVKLYVFKGTCKWWWTSRESNKRRYNNQSCQFGGKCGGAVGRAWSPCRNYCYAVVQGNLVVGCYVLLLGLVCKFSVTMWYIVELNGLLS